MLMAEGARYQAVKPHHQRVEDNAFHLRADEPRWIGFSEDDVSKEAEHFRNARSGDSRVDRESPKKRELKQTLRPRRRCRTRPGRRRRPRRRGSSSRRRCSGSCSRSWRRTSAYGCCCSCRCGCCRAWRGTRLRAVEDFHRSQRCNTVNYRSRLRARCGRCHWYRSGSCAAQW